MAALLTTAETWKQSKCPLTDEWMKKLVRVYDGILLSRKKGRDYMIRDHVIEPGGYHAK